MVQGRHFQNRIQEPGSGREQLQRQQTNRAAACTTQALPPPGELSFCAYRSVADPFCGLHCVSFCSLPLRGTLKKTQSRKPKSRVVRPDTEIVGRPEVANKKNLEASVVINTILGVPYYSYGSLL